MATLSAKVLTLSDYAKRLDPSGMIADIVELLAQVNEILEDAVWIQSNMETGHQYTQRTGLPDVYYRQINQTIPPSKSKTAQITEQCAMLEANSQVDDALLELATDKNGLRLSEAKPFLEALSQKFAGKLIYGNGGTSPEEFSGLSIRYSSLSAGNATNILDAGGTGSDNTSVWLVGWGEEKIACMFPKNTQSGIRHLDLGRQLIPGGTGIGNETLLAWVSNWRWFHGLIVQDWRYAVRVCNIDASNLVADTGAAPLAKFITKATYRLPSLLGCRPVLYMNRTVFEMFDLQRQASVSTGGQLTYKDVDGRSIPMWRGSIPIHIVDQILNTEARVV